MSSVISCTFLGAAGYFEPALKAVSWISTAAFLLIYMTSRYLCPFFWCYTIKLSRIRCAFFVFPISLNRRGGKRMWAEERVSISAHALPPLEVAIFSMSRYTTLMHNSERSQMCVCVQLIRCVPWQMREDPPSNCWNTVALPSFMGQDGCALQRGRGRLNALGWLLMKSEDGVCHSAVIKTTSARHTLAHPKMFDCS